MAGSAVDARLATLAQVAASEETYLHALTAAAQLYLAPLLQVLTSAGVIIA
jgi:hypothetical protein